MSCNAQPGRRTKPFERFLQQSGKLNVAPTVGDKSFKFEFPFTRNVVSMLLNGFHHSFTHSNPDIEAISQRRIQVCGTQGHLG
jgi:hypothetical protein